ncbi:tyrosine-type recombinase/integrase [Sphingomonas hengshuiensis]|uniref:Integrase n=1 Tax=Sphingomonas hengshuiensis TaxID=1609977 RepID=A0A7U5CUJ8_9SPHN|nr:site-specific integrase [Sphingomonas hengshuiensis]AJP70713.1 integrase [Sphingomonas hengshuiensis]
MSDARAEQFKIFQRKGSSIWWVRFSIRGAGQIRNSLGTSDEADARRKADKIWRDATYRSENGLRPVQRSFERVAEEFIKQLEREVERGERRAGVDRRHASLIRRYFIPYFGKKAIEAITDHDVARYQEWRKSYWTTGPGADQTHIEYERGGKRLRRPATDLRGASSLSTQRGEAVVLRQLFRQGAKWGYLNQAQIPDVDTPRVPPSPRPSFSISEMQKLLKLAQNRIWEKSINSEVKRDRQILYAYITIAAASGMRPTEIRNLNWGDILHYREGRTKPARDRDIRIRARGKGKAREFIPLEGTLHEFDRLWDLWKAGHHGAEPADKDPVFAAANGNRLTSINNSLTSLLEAAELKTDHRGMKRDSYSFRHFYISQQLIAGVDVFALARNCGTSPDMIDKFYGQVSVEQLKDQLRPQWR